MRTVPVRVMTVWVMRVVAVLVLLTASYVCHMCHMLISRFCSSPDGVDEVNYIGHNSCQCSLRAMWEVCCPSNEIVIGFP